MTQQQTGEILKAIGTYYPNFLTNTSPDEMKMRVKLWHVVLAKYDYSAVANALVNFVETDTKGYPPVIGQILDKIKQPENVLPDIGYFDRVAQYLGERRFLE